MKKIFAAFSLILVLTGCQSTTKTEVKNISDIFKNEFKLASNIENRKGVVLADNVSAEDIENIFNDVFKIGGFKDYAFEIGEMSQGIGTDGNGGRTFCCKIPVDVEFIGNKYAVEEFVGYFNKFNSAISLGEFNIEDLENEKYKVTTIVNFLGKAADGELSSNKSEYTFKKNEVEVKRKEDIVLRKFDISMVIRPYNSDASAVSIGVTSDKDYRIFNDENSKKNIYVTFSNEGGKYYCEYKIDDISSSKVNIKPSGDILFDVLSCEVDDEEDEIFTDLYVTNNSNKKVSIAIYNDENSRVNIVNKVGNIEVKK